MNMTTNTAINAMKPACASVLRAAGETITDAMKTRVGGDGIRGSEMAIQGLFSIAPLVRCHKYNQSLPCATACMEMCSYVISEAGEGTA